LVIAHRACRSVLVKSAQPTPPARPRHPIAAETACQRWLIDLRRSKLQSPKTERTLWAEARQNWHALSRNAFKRARANALRESGANWGRGRPRKNLIDSPKTPTPISFRFPSASRSLAYAGARNEDAMVAPPPGIDLRRRIAWLSTSVHHLHSGKPSAMAKIHEAPFSDVSEDCRQLGIRAPSSMK
jgi:hypothetical protein